MSKTALKVQAAETKAAARKRRPRSVSVGVRVISEDARAEKGFEFQETLEEAERRQIVAEMARSFAQQLRHYVGYYEQSPEAAEKVERALRDVRASSEHYRKEAENCPPGQLTWKHFEAIAETDIEASMETWARIRLEAVDELQTGRRAAHGVHAKEPIELARFYSIRDAFMDDWEPRGGVESALIEMLAQSFTLYLYWTEISHGRAVEAADEHEEDVNRHGFKGWQSPRQHIAEAIEQAHMMADRYNRMFLRTLRQMRDLRRYAPPVIVNNGGQVNVGQQQVNVSTQGRQLE